MLDPSLIDFLGRIVGGDNVLSAPSDLDRYSTDALTPFRAFKAASLMERKADLVILPHSAEEVAQVVQLAAEHSVPIVPYGGGTGVMGAALPVRGGIVVDLKGLNRVLEVKEADMAAVAPSPAADTNWDAEFCRMSPAAYTPGTSVSMERFTGTWPALSNLSSPLSIWELGSNPT